jgi:hypothetical protein
MKRSLAVMIQQAFSQQPSTSELHTRGAKLSATPPRPLSPKSSTATLVVTGPSSHTTPRTFSPLSHILPQLTNDRSCGVLTEAAEETTSAGYYDDIPLTTCNTKKLTDNKNYCNTTPYYDSNNHADGQVVFVYADCVTGKPLKTGQDSAYNYPGVSAQS